MCSSPFYFFYFVINAVIQCLYSNPEGLNCDHLHKENMSECKDMSDWCLLLLTNLEYCPWTEVGFINTTPRRLMLPVPAAERMNQNLIWLWCIIFILATAPLKTRLTKFKRFKQAKTLQTVQENMGEYIDYIYCSFTIWWLDITYYSVCSTFNCCCCGELCKYLDKLIF